jgi:kynurenine formamidase
VPHCNGTHTECIGHITDQRFSVQEQLIDSLIPCTLVTILPENAMISSEQYNPPKEKGDFFISRSALENALKSVSKLFLRALVIRTLPNDISKMARNYAEHKPPFFSLEAMNFITELGVEHILVDLPSIDRVHDEGKLNTHHLFWKVKPGSLEKTSHSLVNKTITEMIYAANEIVDGSYLLNLQIAPFVSDASPSRPLLYPLIEA